MKQRHCIYIILLACVVITMPLYAGQPRAHLLGGGHTNMSGNQWHIDHHGLRSGTLGYIHNLFGFYVDGSYSCLFSNMPNTHYQPGGYGVGGGLCYEHQRGMFKMQLGVGLRYQNVSNRIDDIQIEDASVRDARGYPYTLHYDFHNRVDSVITLHAQVPILFGVGIRGFYVLGGVKVNYSVKGSTYVRCEGTTSGTYPQFLGQFYEMDNHGLRKEVAVRREGSQLDFRTDILASLETGYEWGIKDRRGVKYRRRVNPSERFEYRLRVAAFADYGLLNICPQTDKALVDIPSANKWDFDAYQMNHVFASSAAQPYNVHNFYAGIKLTVLFGSYIYKTCRLCQEFESEATMNTRGNKGRR